MKRHMKGRAAFAAAFLAASLLHPLGAAGQIPEGLLRGRQVSFEASGSKVSGELLGFDGDRLVLLRGQTVDAWPLAGVRTVSVRQHGLDLGKVMVWASLGGALTGLALTAACSSVDDADCAAVFPATLLSWGLAGLLFGTSLNASSRMELPPHAGVLQPYARFPQGVPPAFSVLAEGDGRARR